MRSVLSFLSIRLFNASFITWLKTLARSIVRRITDKIFCRRAGRNIIMCFDGTGDEYGRTKTNVMRVCELAIQDERQIIFYAPGVGTGGMDYEENANLSLDRWTGAGLDKDLQEGYRFLMDIYQPKDRIYLFGFSRGAFTARCLAGMLYRCGLLHSHLSNLVEYASKIYHKNDRRIHTGFKTIFGRECPVYFIGVWDTVEALSGDEADKFYDYKLNKNIRYAYHAIAIDEKRKKLKPCLWQDQHISSGQIVEQVWFAGVHADVGGGYLETRLSNIALRWILNKAQQCGLRLNNSMFKAMHADPLCEQHESYKQFWRALGIYKRKLPSGAKVHDSVRIRMKHSAYQPEGQFPNQNDVRWVR